MHKVSLILVGLRLDLVMFCLFILVENIYAKICDAKKNVLESNLTLLWFLSRLSRIFEIGDFDPQTQNFYLWKNTYKRQDFRVIQKPGIYAINLNTKNTHSKFQGNIFILGYTLVKIPVKCDDVTFYMQFLHL